jgi:hypothetical protein
MLSGLKLPSFPGLARRAPRKALPGILLGLLLLPGCGGAGWSLGGAGRNAAASAPAATVTSDPVAAFAASAQPGSQQQVILAGGQSANVRLVRSYQAASGRECREVLVGSGMAERSQVVCTAGGGAWEPARPLLRGGAAGR